MATIESPLGSFENPVKCKGIDGEYKYLDSLVGPGGIPIEYARLGSKLGLEGKMIDVYSVSYEGLKKPIHVHINMYAKGPRDKKAVDGLFRMTDFLKTKPWQKLGHLQKVLSDEFPNGKIILPENFAYVYAKAGMLLSYGPYIYAKRDFLGMPEASMNQKGILDCAEQLVHHVRGISLSHPLHVDQEEVIIDFFKTFHFDCTLEFSTEKKQNSVHRASGTHQITEQKLMLYFTFV